MIKNYSFSLPKTVLSKNLPIGRRGKSGSGSGISIFSLKQKNSLKKSNSFCKTEYSSSFFDNETLYEDNMKLKTEINHIRKELLMAKSENVKKDNEIAKKQLLINSSFGLTDDNAKETNLIYKIKKQYASLKKDYKLKQEEIYALKKNVKNSKMNELQIENSALLSEYEKLRALYNHLQDQNEDLMIKTKNYNELKDELSKQHFLILNLQKKILMLCNQNELLLKEINSMKNSALNQAKVNEDKIKKDKEIDDLQNKIQNLLIEKGELEYQNNILQNQIFSMKNSELKKSNEKQTNCKSNKAEQIMEISYILIKNFEAKKYNKERAFNEIFKPIINNLNDDSTVEKKELISVLASKILKIINCSKNENDKNKIVLFISSLLVSSHNDFGNFINNFMQIFDSVRLYDQQIEKDIFVQLKAELKKHNDYFVKAYQNDFISFFAFRNLLNREHIELKDNLIEFLIYKMKQFSNKNETISMFDLCYKNLLNILNSKDLNVQEKESKKREEKKVEKKEEDSSSNYSGEFDE